MSSNMFMSSDGVPYISDIVFDERIPRRFQTSIRVWVHEFTEWSISRILYDFQTFPIYEFRKTMKKYCHILASIVTSSGYLYKGRVMERLGKDFHVSSQKKLDKWLSEGSN